MMWVGGDSYGTLCIATSSLVFYRFIYFLRVEWVKLKHVKQTGIIKNRDRKKSLLKQVTFTINCFKTQYIFCTNFLCSGIFLTVEFSRTLIILGCLPPTEPKTRWPTRQLCSPSLPYYGHCTSCQGHAPCSYVPYSNHNNNWMLHWRRSKWIEVCTCGSFS